MTTVTSMDEDNKEPDFCAVIGMLSCNINYILLNLALSGLFYITTGIQYWVSKYMINELQQSKTTVFIAFGIISITGPVLGIVIGGNITAYLGGARSKRAL